ncbi:MAG: hypothetical protein A2Y92_01585 [Chloroflexi bacterium RBG_13_57_8]|nr:MAG: hypothetical protein A2Y92_01585 [Chloroflexi bacterium RBG_13_57_8]
MSGFQKALAKLTRPNALNFYLLFFVWSALSLFYYFGEIVDLAGWDALRWEFFYSVHDVHRLVFLIPIIYAAYVFGFKASIIISVISLMVFLPRALFISAYPNALARMLIFILISGSLGCLVAVLRRAQKQAH